VGLAGLSLAAGRAAAEEGDESAAAAELAPVDVFQASGLFDEVLVEAIEQAIDDAEAGGSQALILQLNTRGAVVSDDTMRHLLQKVADTKIAIGVWVGPSRSARAYGVPAQLFGVADVTAMVAGSHIGYTGELLTLENGKKIDLGAGTDQLRNGSMSFGDARRLGVLRLDTPDEGVPIVRNMVLAMDGVTLEDGTIVDTVVQELDDQGNEQNVATKVRFSGLGLTEELFHTVASPAMATCCWQIGLCLLVEFFTAGVGVAGVVGAACVLGCYGMAELPARPGAIALLLAAMVAFAVDVQVGIPRFWTGVGVTLFVLGSWFLYSPLPGNDLRLSWITLLVGIGGVLITFIVGMPSMVRTRFATPTIGRDWMIGYTGTAVGAIDPDGVAQVGEAKWRPVHRATPVAAATS
jgi:membrane-bound serine protease (ClpP class)